MLSSRSPFLGSVVALSAGVALGIVSPLLAEVGGSIGQTAHLAFDAGWSWAALAFCVGMARKSKIESVALASVSLVAAVVSYYLTKLGQGEFLTADLIDPSGGVTHTSWQSFLSKTAYWGIVACLLGPLLGWAGNMARTEGLHGLAFRVLVPLIAIVDTSERLRVEGSLQGAVAETTWGVIRLVAVVVIFALIGHTVISRRPRASAGRGRE
ncbi:DUF6518 family protein [Streptomyces sp. NPDC048518]|uniref:DUF6518 family protein n=1 Tax=Streptomyces sp. NPDC048518 TaxID=3155029 RepID=UPI00340E6416